MQQYPVSVPLYLELLLCRFALRPSYPFPSEGPIIGGIRRFAQPTNRTNCCISIQSSPTRCRNDSRGHPSPLERTECPAPDRAICSPYQNPLHHRRTRSLIGTTSGTPAAKPNATRGLKSISRDIFGCIPLRRVGRATATSKSTGSVKAGNVYVVEALEIITP